MNNYVRGLRDEYNKTLEQMDIVEGQIKMYQEEYKQSLIRRQRQANRKHSKRMLTELELGLQGMKLKNRILDGVINKLLYEY